MSLDNRYTFEHITFPSVEFHTDLTKIEPDAKTNFEASTTLGFNKDPSDTLFLVSMEIKFGSKKGSLYIKMTANAFFRSKIEINKENISAWLVEQGKARVYPFVFAKILEITRCVGLPPVNIPMELE